MPVVCVTRTEAESNIKVDIMQLDGIYSLAGYCGRQTLVINDSDLNPSINLSACFEKKQDIVPLFIPSGNYLFDTSQLFARIRHEFCVAVPVKLFLS